MYGYVFEKLHWHTMTLHQTINQTGCVQLFRKRKLI